MKSGWFYNRPGIAAAERDEAEGACRALAAAMLPEPKGDQVAKGLIEGILAENAEASRQKKLPRQISEYVDDCMIASGFRRMQVEATPYETLRRQMADASPEAAAQSAGAEAPLGAKLARGYANENWMPRAGDKPLAPIPVSRRQPDLNLVYARGRPDLGEPPNKAAAPPPGMAVLYGSITGIGRADVLAISLLSLEDDGRPALDPGPVLILQGKGGVTVGRAFMVKPGRYAIAAAIFNGGATYSNKTFCLRTPYVTVAVGDVLHLWRDFNRGAWQARGGCIRRPAVWFAGLASASYRSGRSRRSQKCARQFAGVGG